MPDLEDDLRATADSLLRDLDRMKALEQEKLSLDPTDPRAAELSAQIEELARRTQTTSAAQREIVDEIQATETPE